MIALTRDRLASVVVIKADTRSWPSAHLRPSNATDDLFIAVGDWDGGGCRIVEVFLGPSSEVDKTDATVFAAEIQVRVRQRIEVGGDYKGNLFLRILITLEHALHDVADQFEIEQRFSPLKLDLDDR